MKKLLKISVEFVAPFNEKTGTRKTELKIDVNREGVTVIEIFKALEERFKAENLKLLDGNKIKSGLLVFYRNSAGGTERLKPETVFNEFDSPELVITGMMDGG